MSAPQLKVGLFENNHLTLSLMSAPQLFSQNSGLNMPHTRTTFDGTVTDSSATVDV